MLAAGAVLSAACSYFLFTEMKILSTKKMCVRVRVCLLCDDSDGITFFVVVVFPALQLLLVGFCCSLTVYWFYLEPSLAVG